MSEKYKAGYEGQDSMREKAAKMMGMVEGGSLKVKPSKSAHEKEKPRPYKTGGSVEKSPPYKGTGRSVGVSKGPNAELSIASRDKAPMRGEPSRGPKKTMKDTPPYKMGGAVKKKADGGSLRATGAMPMPMPRLPGIRRPVDLNIERMSEVPKKAGGRCKKMATGGTVGGDVNGPGERMPRDAMQEYPKKKGGTVKKMAAGGVGKLRKGEMNANGQPTVQKRKGYEY